MEYERTVDFTGDRRKALEIAQAALVQAGYRIEEASDRRISARYGGSFLGRNRGNPLWVASPITIEVSDRNITVTADYEGLAKMRKFIIWFLGGLALMLALGLGIPFAIVFGLNRFPLFLALGLGVGIPLIQLPIHLFVTPAIMRYFAAHALDRLVHNMTVLAQR
jgi:hypothetical protein